MQSGVGQPALSAGPVGIGRRYGSVGVLLLGLAVSACVGSGQIANLTEISRVTIAFESIDGPPPAVLHKLMKSLKDEAAARQIAVLPSPEASYRLRGYLAAHGGDAATSISWVLDVYDADQRRAFRLSGEERAAGRTWTGADDQALQRIARAGMTQFAAFASTARPPAATTVAAAPAPQRAAATLGWLDDWTPEASGIFRIFRSEPSRPPEIAADAGSPVAPAEVPVPRGRPSPAGAPTGSALAFAAENETR
jgi:hypothetical protein